MSSVRRVLFLLAASLALTGIALAQTTGNIRGEVTDETGGVLPGATVTISSEALIGGTRTVVRPARRTICGSTGAGRT